MICEKCGSEMNVIKQELSCSGTKPQNFTSGFYANKSSSLKTEGFLPCRGVMK